MAAALGRGLIAGVAGTAAMTVYPRGYARMGIGQREPWEGEEEFSVDPVADVKDRGLE